MTGPVGIEIEETEGADLGRMEAGAGQMCDRCGGTSFTGPRCTRCTFASRPSPPWPVGWDSSEASEATEAVSAPAVQDPEFVCPLWCAHGEPKPVTDLANAAAERDWKVQVRHSRGGVMGGNGKQLAVADMWTVRFRRPGWMGYAARRGDLWDSVAVAGTTLSPFLALGVTDLKEWLANPDQDQEWYAKIRKRVADQEKAKKIVKCPGPGKCHAMLVGEAFKIITGRQDSVPDHTHRANGDIKIKTSKKEQVAGL